MTRQATSQAPRSGIIDTGDLRYFMRIVSKNWYLVVVALLLSAVLAYLYTYKLPEYHGASTQILLKDKEVYNYQSQVYQSIGYFGAYGDIVNQKRVLTSYDLIDEALDRLDFDVSYFIIGRFRTSEVYNALPFRVDVEVKDSRLHERPFDLRVIDADRFELSYEGRGGLVSLVHDFGSWLENDELDLRVLRTRRFSAADLQELTGSMYQFVPHHRQRLVDRYKYGISVENLDYTSILEIRVEDQVAAKAKVFLDTLSKVYIEHTLRSEFDINENTLRYIDRQLEEVTDILNEFETDLERYKETNDILDLGKEEDRHFNELVVLDRQVRTMELDLLTLDDLETYVLNIDQAEKLIPPSFYILENDVFQQETLRELYELQMSRSEMLFEATPDNLGLQQLDESIERYRQNLLTYIANTRLAIRQKIDQVKDEIRMHERYLRSIPGRQRDLLNIARRVQVNEKMYLFLLEKRANTVIARAGIVPQTKVIESARHLGVVRPDKTRILYGFLTGGLLLSLVIVFVRLMFYDRVENADQLKSMTHLPVFGEIIASEKAEENYVVVDSDPKAAITESFRAVRTNLEYLPETERGKVVMITSYRPNEGKTFCSVNLGAILAKAGKRVLLLELDLHKPKVAAGLNMSHPVGLSNLLVGKASMEEVVLPTSVENCDVILSGPTPPNASELVLSEHMGRLLDKARSIYDYVIIDTPPVGLITDALILMKHADAVLFVINTRFASREHVNNAMEVFQQNPVRNFGFILNGVRMKKSKYYYNTNYGYGYRYAYGYGSGYGYGYGYSGRRRSRRKEGSGPDKRDAGNA